MITVLLADDHAVVAEGFATLLKDNFNVVGMVNDGRSLVARLPSNASTCW